MNKQQKIKNQISKVGKVSTHTLGSVWGKAIEGGATRALPFIRGS